MEKTKEQITEAVLTSAAELAEKLGMTQRELKWQALCEDELMMLVTAEGITIGKVNASFGEMRTYKYEYYYVNGVALLEKTYGITEQGWEHMPKVTMKLDEDTILYMEY
jgi:hypothetical protein